MDYLPPTDQSEDPNQGDNYNRVDLESRLNNAEDVLPDEQPLPPAETQTAASDNTQLPAAETTPLTPEQQLKQIANGGDNNSQVAQPPVETQPTNAPPDGHIPAIATDEIGTANRAERGPETPEIKIYHAGSERQG